MSKAGFLFLFLFVGFVAIMNAQNGKEYDNSNGTSMMPITYNLDDMVKTIEKQNVEIVRIEFDLIFDSKTSFRTLTQGYTYGIIVWGDYRIQDMVVRIYKRVDGDWKYVADGEQSGNTSSIKFQTTVTEEYKFEIRVLQFVQGYSAGHYGLIVFHN